MILIDIPQRTSGIGIDDAAPAQRRSTRLARGWKPALPRRRQVSAALQAYAPLTTRADLGTVKNRVLLDG